MLAALIAAAAAFVMQPNDSAAPARQQIAIVGVNVLPMSGAERLADQTVLVDGDRIAVVGNRSSVRVPAGYTIIEGRGRTVMPGLVDMHMHLSPEPGAPGDSTARALALSLANGVTTGRVMLGQPSHPSVRAKVEAGTLAGPRLYIAAPSIADQNTTEPDAAREKLRKAKADGFDLMKLHGITSVPVWEAAVDEARKLSLPVAGHVTNAIGLKRALAAGQQVEHLDSVPAELMPASASRDFGQFLEKTQLDVLATLPDSRFVEVARLAKRESGHFVPTLAAFERIAEMRRPFDGMLSEPDAQYVAPWIIDQWRTRRQNLVDGGFTVDDSERMGAVRRKIVKAFRDAGVPLMVGSDTPHPFHIWGFGAVREIEALAQAGLTPMEALKAATVVPRDYFRGLPAQGSALGWKADFGTVTPGARADLLLLDGDPSRDLKALHAINRVIAGGRVYDRATLQAMLAEASKSGKAQKAPGG